MHAERPKLLPVCSACAESGLRSGLLKQLQSRKVLQGNLFSPCGAWRIGISHNGFSQPLIHVHKML